MQNTHKVNILGIDFLNITQKQLVARLIQDDLHHQNRFVVTANPEIVLAARKNPQYQTIINQADYVTADGIGIIKGAKILKKPLPERVTGYDTMLELLQYANQAHKKVYFLGAKEAVIQSMIPQIQKKYPNLIIAGYHHGYFKNAQPIIDEIKHVQPDFIFVALGFPRQDFFIAAHRQSVDAIWMGVGGSFDVLSGNIKRAPQFWIDHHIEWLYRLIQEPQRFKRMLALPKYLALVYLQKIKKNLVN
ncbi:WecB/TagA/CpsF family glycosyltransferase [Ligilactobacillus sp. LYQ135]